MDWHITTQQVADFSAMSGDFNALHTSEHAAQQAGFSRPIAHGMLLMALAEGAWQQHFGTQPAYIDCRFLRPVFVPATLHVILTKQQLQASCNGELVIHIIFQKELDE